MYFKSTFEIHAWRESFNVFLGLLLLLLLFLLVLLAVGLARVDDVTLSSRDELLQVLSLLLSFLLPLLNLLQLIQKLVLLFHLNKPRLLPKVPLRPDVLAAHLLGRSTEQLVELFFSTTFVVGVVSLDFRPLIRSESQL